jgi:hypothetical protein
MINRMDPTYVDSKYIYYPTCFFLADLLGGVRESMGEECNKYRFNRSIDRSHKPYVCDVESLAMSTHSYGI